MYMDRVSAIKIYYYYISFIATCINNRFADKCE